ncbi:hypothetical protein BWD42_05210 [Sphingobacterium sp. CZ-UAM]|nr:hypothetical protein BWD42_05210 [Sphingobacterium sp. CZ-UAM]
MMKYSIIEKKNQDDDALAHHILLSASRILQINPLFDNDNRIIFSNVCIRVQGKKLLLCDVAINLHENILQLSRFSNSNDSIQLYFPSSY